MSLNSSFMEPVGPFPCMQEHVTEPYPELDESRQDPRPLSAIHLKTVEFFYSRTYSWISKRYLFFMCSSWTVLLKRSPPHPSKYFTHDIRSYSQLIKPHIISEVEPKSLNDVTIDQNQFGMEIRERGVIDTLSIIKCRALRLSCGTLRYHKRGSYSRVMVV
jgi:hypothetical protein